MDKLFKTLGDQNRLRIVNLLLHSKLCVCELEVILQTTQSNVSRHLSRLRNERIIAFEKKAQWIYYFIDPSFKEENASLYQYMELRMSTEQLFINDVQRLQRYARSGENCETLKEKEGVIFAS